MVKVHQVGAAAGLSRDPVSPGVLRDVRRGCYHQAPLLPSIVAVIGVSEFQCRYGLLYDATAFGYT